MDFSLENLLRFHEQAGTLTVEQVVLCLLSTFVFSQAVGWVYIRAHRGISYSASMAQSLVALALIVALVMLVVGDNLARAFGLFGALALIRFRTPVKDTKDTIFLFLSVALGIATGTGHILAAAVGCLIICLVLLYLAFSRFGSQLSHDGLFRFRLPSGSGQEGTLQGILQRYCDSFRLIHMRETGVESTMEYSYQIKMIDSRYSTQLITEMEGVEGIDGLSLLMQDGEEQP